MTAVKYRVAAAFIVYILCVFKWQEAILTIGHWLGLSGFLALFVPAAAIALSIYRIIDIENWGVLDAAGLFLIGIFAYIALTNDPRSAALDLIRGVVSFSIATILGALVLKGGRRNG